MSETYPQKPSSQPTRSLAQIAGIVAIATLLSKGMGFVRQLLVAAYFGSGPEFSAFAVAYVLPGFLLVLLGGINGPFHSAIVSVLKKRPDQDQSRWLESITTFVGLILLGITLILMLTAEVWVRLLAAGASPTVLELAAHQLRIMSPLALLAGFIGIGFGTLNASNQFTLPALSPVLSSLMIMIALISFGPTRSIDVLAWGTLAGAVAQWLVQLPVQSKLGLGRPRLRFEWGSPEVKAVGLLMLPAVISSGMIHINVYVDIFFASFVPGDRTIGNLGYAQLLVQTPLGLLSNVVLVPLMPLFSSLAVPDRWPDFRDRIRQSLIVSALMILPMSMVLVVLARPIVQLVYERGRFTPDITAEVAALLMAYGLGMLFYLLRDVMVRVFYALEDGRTPLMISAVAIGLNAGFDYLGLKIWGAPGLALATAAVNTVAFIWLCLALQRRIGDLPWADITRTLTLLLGSATIAGGLTWALWRQLEPFSTLSPVATITALGITMSLGLLVFVGLTSMASIPEVEVVVRRFQGLYPRFFNRAK